MMLSRLTLASKSKSLKNTFAKIHPSYLLFRVSYSKDVKTVIRKMLPSELEIIKERALQENMRIGPLELDIIYNLDNSDFRMVEINGELASHFYVVNYPGSHSYGGGTIVTEKFRKMGLFEKILSYTIENSEETQGGDIRLLEMIDSKYKAWKLYSAMIDLKKMATLKSPMECDIESIDEENLQAVIGYDAVVFGTERGGFVRDWLSSPGVMGWLALDGNQTVIGYTAVRLVLRNRGTSIGLALLPLMADNSLVARALIQHAGRECLVNKAVPKTSVELFHPLNLSQGAGEILTELDAEMIHICDRVYSKGIPPKRQLGKIYSIAGID